MKKIVKKFPQTTSTLKIANSKSNFISNISQDFRRFSYVVWCAEYVKNSWKIPADTLDLENNYFKVKDALRIFFPLFFPFLAHQWGWKAISNFRLCKKWNVSLTIYIEGEGYLSDFFQYFFRIQSIKWRRKTLWNPRFY